ncbi:transmembrane protein 217 [Sceloporus undulatus]|uniref:transmembrane protein 217 n=1 Tax=Sceloporus undulatus TaxID=8520 RepID=UPI001C4C54AF|nr:transmembrane protein 217 [Sceloporus undulatus]XP_042317554.1 transmembrane protein 217 [Sceloporus undulatus]XP_042317556.1 transmembrane protein 217 [Sceloporus undulatus]XP_042317557.1 transmembrane protein 217 [Sceloporus undulatus]XP_042317558.1 transmembrane protein 217 [Sceloporus undulatus]
MNVIQEKVFLLCAGGFCGITPKGGSVLAGVYMILMTNMYLIFEIGHLNASLLVLQKFEAGQFASIIWNIPYYYYVAIALAFISYPICIYFLYSIRKRDTVGLFIYLTWIVFYDVANCVIVVLTSRAAKRANFAISPLEWFGLATRIPLDCVWLSFIVAYAMIIIEGRRTGRMSLRTRRISKHVTEPPKFRLGVNTRRIQ